MDHTTSLTLFGPFGSMSTSSTGPRAPSREQLRGERILARQAQRHLIVIRQIERLGLLRYQGIIQLNEVRISSEKVARRAFEHQARARERVHQQRAAQAVRRAPRHSHRFKGRR